MKLFWRPTENLNKKILETNMLHGIVWILYCKSIWQQLTTGPLFRNRLHFSAEWSVMDWIGCPNEAYVSAGQWTHQCLLVMAVAAWRWLLRSVEQSTESDNNHSFRAADRRDLELGPPANIVSLWLQHDSRQHDM